MKAQIFTRSICVFAMLLFCTLSTPASAADVQVLKGTKQTVKERVTTKTLPNGGTEKTWWFDDQHTKSYKIEQYNKTGKLVHRKLIDRSGKPVYESIWYDNGSKTDITYNINTGKKQLSATVFRSGSQLFVIYRRDGKTPWTVTTIDLHLIKYIVGGATDDYYALDGTKHRRIFRTDGSMDVLVWNLKTWGNLAQFMYQQKWVPSITGVNRFKLVSVDQRIAGGSGKRLIIMNPDGKSIDRVEYYHMNLSKPPIGWVLSKTEKPGKLSQPIDPNILKDTDPKDDFTYPKPLRFIKHNSSPTKTRP